MDRIELAPVTDSCECRNIKFEMAGSEITSCFIIFLYRIPFHVNKLGTVGVFLIYTFSLYFHVFN